MKTYQIVYKDTSSSKVFESISEVFDEISQTNKEIDKILFIFSQGDMYFEVELT